TLAVVVALVVIKGTWIGSHVRHVFHRTKSALKERIPAEQEILRLRMELDNLAREDERHFDTVARQKGALTKLENEVSLIKKDLGERETRIRAMRTSLAGEDKFVTYNGERYSRSDVQSQLRLSAQTFQVDEATLRSKEAQVAAKRQLFELNKKKLSELKLV